MAIYAVLVQGIAAGDDMMGAIWICVGYTVLLCFVLFKAGSLSKSIWGAHKNTVVKYAVEFYIKSGYTKGRKGECDYAEYQTNL